MQPTNPAQPASPPTAAAPVGTGPRTRLLVIGLVVAGVLVLALGALGVGYATGLFADKGRYAVAPEPCSLLDNDLAGRFTPHGTVSPGSQGCEINAPGPPVRLVLQVTRVAAKGATGAPSVASNQIRTIEKRGDIEGWRRLAGVGDEAIVAVHASAVASTVVIVARVSNLVVTIFASAAQGLDGTSATPPLDGAVAVATEVARRLRAG